MVIISEDMWFSSQAQLICVKDPVEFQNVIWQGFSLVLSLVDIVVSATLMEAKPRRFSLASLVTASYSTSHPVIMLST